MPLLETTHHRHGDAPYVPDQSRAERLTSFEPADFGSPTGREEEWRFTPVDRLRALFRDEPTGLVPGLGRAPSRGRHQLRCPGRAVAAGRPAPARRPRRRRRRSAQRRRRGHRHPRRGRARRAGADHLSGAEGQLVHGHLWLRVGANARATVVLDHTGLADYSEVLTVSVGDGRPSASSRSSAGTTRRRTWPSTMSSSAATRRPAISPSPWVAGWSAQHQCDVCRSGRIVRGARGLLRRRGPAPRAPLFVDHSAPRCSSDVLYKGALQGRRRAHRVGR